MFNATLFAYAFIDSFQANKKKLVELTVKDEGIKKALNGFVDAQAKYTKAAVDAGIASASAIGTALAEKADSSPFAQPLKSMTKKAK